MTRTPSAGAAALLLLVVSYYSGDIDYRTDFGLDLKSPADGVRSPPFQS